MVPSVWGQKRGEDPSFPKEKPQDGALLAWASLWSTRAPTIWDQLVLCPDWPGGRGGANPLPPTPTPIPTGRCWGWAPLTWASPAVMWKTLGFRACGQERILETSSGRKGGFIKARGQVRGQEELGEATAYPPPSREGAGDSTGLQGIWEQGFQGPERAHSLLLGKGHVLPFSKPSVMRPFRCVSGDFRLGV